MRLLLLIPHHLADDRHAAVRDNERPQADYDAIAEAVRAMPNGQADILDRTSVDRAGGLLVRLALRLWGYNVALALLGFQRRKNYDAVFSHSEIVALPLALLTRPYSRRPRHVTTAYYLTGRRNILWYRVLHAHRSIDIIFTLSKEQFERARELKIPDSKSIFLQSCGYVDAAFFGAATSRTVNERQICSTGLEYRDYETLLAAVAELPGVKLKIDPASPWSLHRSAVGESQLPPNAEIVHMKLGAAKQLYAESVAVVIPLRANPIGAGTATMVEAMLMGKPVVITRSPDKTFAGRRDLVDGENVVIVDPGNAAVLREAIQRVVTDQDFRRRIATGGREWARRHADRKEWLAIMIGALRGPEPGKDSASAGR